MKKAVSLILCACLLLGACGYAVYAVTSAEILQEIGIMKGTENGLETERNVTRAEALVMVYRVCGLDAQGWVDVKYSPFTDTVGHWAQYQIEDAYKNGYIHGVSETAFAPERTVTGREFVKMLLSVLGYEGITIENAYDKGTELSLLVHRATKEAVESDTILTRDVTATICHSALLIKTPQGQMVKNMLVERGKYTEDDFRALYSVDPAEPVTSTLFADRLNALIPKTTNYMFSPLSIKLAFAMAANGAQGETRQELLTALGIADLEAFNQYAAELIAAYNATEAVELNIANAIWVNTSKGGGKLAGGYTKLVSEYFDAETGTVTDKTAEETINAWVREKTKDKIPSIADNSEFYAFLANAVYFKAAWENEFMITATGKEDFTNLDGTLTNTYFMHQIDYFNYGETNGVRILELPYKNYVIKTDENGEYAGREVSEDIDISMYILLGDGTVDNPQAVLEQASLQHTRVNLSMPKFEESFGTGLKEIMQSLGAKRIFEPMTSELFGIIENQQLYIDKTMHKSYIKVDEEGTEAAAVTGMAVGATSARPAEPIEFRADRPFAYIIRDNLRGEILFMGQYVQANP